jgi:large subunit ribosomal protein L35
MPKMKSKSAAKKRFSFTGTGKVKRNKAYARHILTKKSPKQKRRLRARALVDKTQVHQIKAMLPYGN